MLAAKNVQKKYGQLQVLKGVDIDIAEGEIVSIVGSSGAGKSTLLHILGTLDSADKGEILLKNQRVDKLKGNKLAAFRNREIGFVFQFHHLLPEFTAVEIQWLDGDKKVNIQLPTKGHLSGMPKWSPDGRHIAFGMDTEQGVEVWTADTRSGKARGSGTDDENV